jgi:hypothetical protein
MDETALQLPDRVGAKPETGPTIPHLQHSDISPPQIRDQLRDWARTAFEATTYGPSGVSVPSSEAYFLGPNPARVAEVELMPPLRYRNMLVDLMPGSPEWAHLHADGSVHVCLNNADEAEVLGRNWGEPHPLRERGVREILVYAPRTIEEIEILKTVFEASYRYATTGD